MTRPAYFLLVPAFTIGQSRVGQGLRRIGLKKERAPRLPIGMAAPSVKQNVSVGRQQYRLKRYARPDGGVVG